MYAGWTLSLSSVADILRITLDGQRNDPATLVKPLAAAVAVTVSTASDGCVEKVPVIGEDAALSYVQGLVGSNDTYR